MNSMEKNPLRKEEGILSRKNPFVFYYVADDLNIATLHIEMLF